MLTSTTAGLGRGLGLAGDLMTEAWACASAVARLARGSGALMGSTARPQLRAGDCTSRPPVMLIHGLAADRSCFDLMGRRLREEGYTVFSASCSCLGSDIERCARSLVQDAVWLLSHTGADRLHVVAHSLGGVVVRWAATHTQMRHWLDVAVTLGSPHHGTPTARLAPAALPGFGLIISQLRPGLLEADATVVEASSPARWVAVASRRDWVVPARYAALPRSGNVRNVVVPSGGHMSLTRNPECLSVILEELAAAEHRRRVDAAA